ncbi:hypothetical protein TruAng_009241 [Truncatella angustata]|nr:hypothetical protein TruAng_009241 [Truncatella angustata]
MLWADHRTTLAYRVPVVARREDPVRRHTGHRGAVARVAEQYYRAQPARRVIPQKPARPPHDLRPLRIARQHHLGTRTRLPRRVGQGCHGFRPLGRPAGLEPASGGGIVDALDRQRRAVRVVLQRGDEGRAGEEAHVTGFLGAAGEENSYARTHGVWRVSLDGGEEIAGSVVRIVVVVQVRGDVVDVDDAPQAILVGLARFQGGEQLCKRSYARIDDLGEVDVFAEHRPEVAEGPWLGCWGCTDRDSKKQVYDED